MDKFRVNFIDGSFLENLSQEEVDQIIKSPIKDWTSVTSMDYMKNCDPKSAKGKFKHGK
jgi:hypothetical protein